MRQGIKSTQESPKVVNGGLGPQWPSPQSLGLNSKGRVESPGNRDGSSAQDLEFNCDMQAPSLIPEGKYTVGFLRAERKWLWGREKIFLWFQILDCGDFQGEELYLACNAPIKRKRGKMPSSNKYYQLWVLSAGRKPDRFDRMSTKVFQGKVFLVQVRNVITNAKNVTRPQLLQYSVIDSLLETLTESE